jgi:hypothetical protein
MTNQRTRRTLIKRAALISLFAAFVIYLSTYIVKPLLEMEF